MNDSKSPLASPDGLGERLHARCEFADEAMMPVLPPLNDEDRLFRWANDLSVTHERGDMGRMIVTLLQFIDTLTEHSPHTCDVCAKHDELPALRAENTRLTTALDAAVREREEARALHIAVGDLMRANWNDSGRTDTERVAVQAAWAKYELSALTDATEQGPTGGSK